LFRAQKLTAADILEGKAKVDDLPALLNKNKKK
jgi:hypothetical protein